jgi:hypothetical protein
VDIRRNLVRGGDDDENAAEANCNDDYVQSENS